MILLVFPRRIWRYYHHILLSFSRDNAQDYIKGLAPWIKDEQIGYDKERNPLGISGFHTSFPLFHWKCRTTTIFSIWLVITSLRSSEKSNLFTQVSFTINRQVEKVYTTGTLLAISISAIPIGELLTYFTGIKRNALHFLPLDVIDIDARSCYSWQRVILICG